MSSSETIRVPPPEKCCTHGALASARRHDAAGEHDGLPVSLPSPDPAKRAGRLRPRAEAAPMVALAVARDECAKPIVQAHTDFLRRPNYGHPQKPRLSLETNRSGLGLSNTSSSQGHKLRAWELAHPALSEQADIQVALRMRFAQLVRHSDHSAESRVLSSAPLAQARTRFMPEAERDARIRKQ